MRSTLRRKLLSCMLIGAACVTMPGCGPEIVPLVIVGLSITSMAVITIGGIQQIENASLDRELKQLQLKGIKNGQYGTTVQTLSSAQVKQIQSTGQVKVNGKTYPVSLKK